MFLPSALEDEKTFIVVRPSGTEPLVRVMIEGKDIDLISREAKKLAALIEENLGE